MRFARSLASKARQTLNGSPFVRLILPFYFLRASFDRGGFVIFHAGRCGSTVLSDMLQQHSHVHCGNELFYGYYGPARKYWLEQGVNTNTVWTASPFYPHDPVGFLRTQIPWAGLCPHFGFEITLYQMKWNGFEFPSFLADLAKCRIDRFIVLQRKNYLKKIVSGMVASQKGKFHSLSGEDAKLNRIRLDVTDVKVDFDEKPLLEYFEEFDRQFQELREALVGKEALWLTYEGDIYQDPLVGYQKCADFLGLEEQPVHVRMGKSNPFPLTDVLANYEEVAAILMGTPYEWMLGD